mgnify:CR=1 FL=1
MANATGKRADKRTAEQRKNDAAQKRRPKGAQDTTFVTTGPATGKEDERAVGTKISKLCDVATQAGPGISWGVFGWREYDYSSIYR